MSDLSWLNPTPHTIAVYASSPLSPAATQHSLPSGRYPLLGPDFHRLDRTSLRLAHSLDHLIGAGEQRRRHGEPSAQGRAGDAADPLSIQKRLSCPRRSLVSCGSRLADARPHTPSRLRSRGESRILIIKKGQPLVVVPRKPREG